MDPVVEFLKGELVRVQNERDAAQANERQLWAVIAELKEQVGMLDGTMNAAWTASNDDAYLGSQTFEDVDAKVRVSRERANELMDTRAVTK